MMDSRKLDSRCLLSCRLISYKHNYNSLLSLESFVLYTSIQNCNFFLLTLRHRTCPRSFRAHSLYMPLRSIHLFPVLLHFAPRQGNESFPHSWTQSTSSQVAHYTRTIVLDVMYIFRTSTLFHSISRLRSLSLATDRWAPGIPCTTRFPRLYQRFLSFFYSGTCNRFAGTTIFPIERNCPPPSMYGRRPSRRTRY